MNVRLVNLETHTTPEGVMIPLYRDWDSFHDSYQPKMVYVTTIGPSLEKGPILHEHRRGFMTAVSGEVFIEVYEEDLKEFCLHDDKGNSSLALIPAGVPVKIINRSKTQTATIINMPDISWHPENQDTLKFKNWEEYIEYTKKK